MTKYIYTLFADANQNIDGAEFLIAFKTRELAEQYIRSNQNAMFTSEMIKATPVFYFVPDIKTINDNCYHY
jgi:hypothetical protein